jgi:hypothetical protein
MIQFDAAKWGGRIETPGSCSGTSTAARREADRHPAVLDSPSLSDRAVEVGVGSPWVEISAVATALAVVVALVTPWIVEALRKRSARRRIPMLDLRFEPHADRAIERVLYSDGPEGHAAWIRLGVSNAAGREAAREVEVLLESARATPAPGQAEVPPVLIAYPAVPWTHVPAETTRVTIPAGATRSLDVATIYLRGDARKALNLLIAAAPFDQRNRVDPGRYELIFVVTAHNADAQRYVVELEWDGEFGGHRESIWDHVAVSSPRLLPPLGAT